MADLLDEFRENYHVKRLTVARNASWTWSVRTVQATLGAGMLSPHRAAPSMGEVTREEMADLASILRVVEHTVRATFHNDRINYIALMMVDPLAHFHFFPRFQSARTFAGHEWLDSTWPKSARSGRESRSEHAREPGGDRRRIAPAPFTGGGIACTTLSSSAALCPR